MNRDYRNIVTFLRGVRRRKWTAGAAAAFLKAAVIAAVAVTLNLFLVDGRGDWPWAAFALALAGTLACYGALAGVAAALLRPPSIREAGRIVEGARGEFRDDIVTSLEVGGLLQGRREDISFSAPLALALLSATREALGACRPSQFVSWRGVGAWTLRLAVVILPLAVFTAAGGRVTAGPVRALVDPSVYWPLSRIGFDVEPGSIRIVAGSDLEVSARLSGPRPAKVSLVADGRGGEVRTTMDRAGDGDFRALLTAVDYPLRYRVAAAGSASSWFDVTVAIPPKAGSFEGRFVYPVYTGLPERRQAFNGHLEVLPGTEVEISFATTVPLSEGRLFLGDTVSEITPRGEGRYGVSFFLNGEKSYRLELKDEDGFSDPDPPEYTITYTADEAPRIEIAEPRREVVLGVALQIPVLFRSSDDFGFSRISLVHRDPSGREIREKIPLGRGGRTIEGEYLWDAGSVEMPPGSRVEVFLEALDNDTITGPKAARSNSFTLLVPDVEEEHRKAEALLEELIEQLVDTLGDELDLLGRYESQEAAAAEEWNEFPREEFAAAEELRTSLEEDAPALGETVAALQEQMAADAMSRPESFFQLERIAAGLENMNRTSREPRGEIARSIDPEDVVREEMAQKTDFMKRYTEEAVAALEQMVLQAEEMQRERNMADIRESGAEMMDMQEGILAKIESLEEDDSEAMEELQNALTDLENMMRDLMEALEKENRLLPEEFLNSDALEDLPVSDIMKGLEEIRRMLAAGDLEGARRAAEEMLRNLGDLMNRLRQAGDDFRNRSRQALNRMKNSTIPEIDRLIAEQKRILEETQEIDEKLQQRKSESDGIPDDPPGTLEEGEKEVLSEMADEEMALSEDSRNLAEEAAALKAALPMLDPSVENNLRASSEEMEDAGGELAGNRPGGAVPSERNALSRLMQARDSARQSLQAMEQMQGFREGKGSMGIHTRPFPGGTSPMPQTGESMGGRAGSSVRSFRLPGKEDYSVPPLFRQEILESLKEGYPAGYEGRIREYFHRITE